MTTTTPTAKKTTSTTLPPWLRPPKVCPSCGNADARAAGPYEDGTGKHFCGANGCGWSSRVAPPPGPASEPAVFRITIDLDASSPDEVGRALRSLAETFLRQGPPLVETAGWRSSGASISIRKGATK